MWLGVVPMVLLVIGFALAATLLVMSYTERENENFRKGLRLTAITLAIVMLLLAVELYLIRLYPPPCTTPNAPTNICNYLMSIWLSLPEVLWV